MRGVSWVVVGAIWVTACARGQLHGAEDSGRHYDASPDAHARPDAAESSGRADPADAAVVDAASSDANTRDAALGDTDETRMDAAAPSDATMPSTMLADAISGDPAKGDAAEGDAAQTAPVCHDWNTFFGLPAPADAPGGSRLVLPEVPVCGTPLVAEGPRCAGLCGNGQIDSCTINTHSAPPFVWSDDCEGANLQGKTCVDLGFAAGELSCSAQCRYDSSGCAACILSSRTTSCADLGARNSLALATSGSELGLAWSDRSQSVRFSRLTPSFSELSSTACGTIPLSRVDSLAPSAAGWLIYGEGSLAALDSNGTFQRSRSVGSSPIPGVLVPHPDGNPLLLWLAVDSAPVSQLSAYTLHFELLDANAAAIVQGELPNIYVNSWEGVFAGVFTGDGFEIAATPAVASAELGREPGPIQLWHIGLDGAVRVDASVPGPGIPAWGPNASSPLRLAWSDSQVRLHYEDHQTSCGYQHFVQYIAPDGSLVGERIPVGTFNDLQYYNPSLFAAGDDTVLLTPPTLQRLDRNGSAVWPAVRFAQVLGNQFNFVMVEDHGDAVIAWSPNDSAAELTRIRIAP
jgi:hypothetical protein